MRKRAAYFDRLGERCRRTLMKNHYRLTGVIERENDGFVALCPELVVASQGDSIEQARANLIEAVELFREAASPAEIADRMGNEMDVTSIEVSVG